ncbi:GNAT family N-acetyltransferase [Paractinoplanes durhamensis]|uniref:N-acetyltransferase n=1 Tax=Paractinoplanes durhamensis TaxID=113563 RepID=A0ABQ3Z466_9ACTN|nr:GNAT family protein [Actinoplanes durhamensis]GIE04597.1 N-acetyltransferase [Actinoplanes durhamensis]
MIPTTNALTGARIRFRELREVDLADLVTWWQDPDVLISQTNGPLHPRPADAIAEQFRAWNRNQGTDAGFIVVTRDGGTMLGHVSLWGADVHNRTATFAIIIGPPHQGQGYGGEATRLMVRYGFTELNLHRIQLSVLGYNERALHTYAKAGFTDEGRDREAVFRGGRWHDQVRMGILDHEWHSGNPE